MDDPERSVPVIEVTGMTLPSHLKGCRCGARVVDVRGYLDHNNLRAVCTACGAELDVNIPRAALGADKDARPTRFRISPGVRFDTFRRDKFCCVHCGRPAPRAGDAFEQIRSTLIAIVGSERELSVARDAHAAKCVTCGNLLPGVLQSIPFAVVDQMRATDRSRLFDVLDRQRLTIDHIYPVSILEIDGVVNGPIESALVSKDLLATSCMECNWGRRESLEDWTELKPFLENVILRGLPNQRELLGHAHEIYFRVRLQLIKRAG